MQLRRATAVGVAVAASALLAAACGSSNSNPTASKGSATQVAAQNACVATVNKLTALQEAPPHITLPALPQTLSSLGASDKTVWFIGGLANSAINNGRLGAQAAAAAAGVKFRAYNDNFTVTGENEGMQLAIAAKPAAIILDAVSIDQVDAQVSNAAAAHIPVVSIYEIPSPGQAGITSVVAVPNFAPDMVLAVLSATKCDTGVFLPYIPDLAADVTEHQVEIATLKKYCPTCTYVSTPYALATAETQLGSVVQGAVGAHPDINAVIDQSDTGLNSIAQTEKSLGDHWTIVSEASGAEGANAFSTGEVAALAQNFPAQIYGWEAMDSVFRALENVPQPTTERDEYIQLFDAHNRTSDWSLANAFPTLNNYESVFTKAWGLSG